MGCTTGVAKYSLFVLNILWMIIGFLVIIFGVLGWGAMPDYYSLGFVVFGGIVFLLSFFGCFGVVRESAYLVWTYAACLLVLLTIIVAFMILRTRNVFKKFASQVVEDLWNKELVSPGAMDTMQTVNSCCGFNSPQDYIAVGRNIPSSCCKYNNCINPKNIYSIGCLDKVEVDFADETIYAKYCEWGLLGCDVGVPANFTYICFVTIQFLISFQLILLVVATLLAIRFTNRNRRYKY